jgi:hypothetical protein
MKYLKLVPAQLELFENLKSSNDLAYHGPLSRYQSVPVHNHSETALYVVSNGAAVYENGCVGDLQVLSPDHLFNAVLVDSNESHGWVSLLTNTLIEHVFGAKNIQPVIGVIM